MADSTETISRPLPAALGIGLLIAYLGIGVYPEVPIEWWAIWLFGTGGCGALVAYKTNCDRASIFWLLLPVVAWCLFWLVMQIAVGRVEFGILDVTLLSFLASVGVGVGFVSIRIRVRQKSSN